MKPPLVEVYSAWNCPYCIRAKRLLRSRSVAFRQYQVWLLFFWILPTSRFKEMVARSGRDSVPQIFVDGKHLGGCDDLFRLDQSGELDQWLGSR
jgi:glutaredoxin 3